MEPVSSTSSTTNSLQNVYHELAEQKLADLKKQESKILNHFQPVLESIKDESKTAYEKLELLAGSLRKSPQYHASSELMKELQVFLKNAKDNPTIRAGLIQVWIDRVKKEIQHSVQKATYSNLYGKLFEDWMEKNSSAGVSSTNDQTDANEKHQTVDELTKKIFSKPADFNKEAFLKFLNRDLFQIEGNEKNKELFNRLIFQATQKFSEAEAFEITPRITIATIKGLHSNNLFSKEKQETLLELLRNSNAITEIAGILSDRVRNFTHWTWPSAVNVRMAKGISGHYRAYMDEDILTAIFLQLVGVQWGIHFKSVLKSLYRSDFWKRPEFLGQKSLPNGIEKCRQNFYSSVFLSTLPDTIESQSNVNPYDDEMEETYSRRNRNGRLTPFQLKQKIVHVINAEVKLNEVVNPDGGLTVVQTDMEWFGPSLVHEAILTILEFFGVSSEWLEFFERFLRAPIRVDGGKIQTRERGVPISHSLSSLFGEINLFLVDLLVNRTTGENLYRLYDDFWFWGRNPVTLGKAWTGIQEFSAMAGLTINTDKSGSVVTGSEKMLSEFSKISDSTIKEPEMYGAENLPQNSVRSGCLKLYSRGGFQLDQELMTPMVDKMSQLLETSTSVFGWINVYNNYMRFFIRNCGKPARILGRHHLAQLIGTLQIIHWKVFLDGNPIVSLKAKFPEILDDVVDSWIYWPMTWGGLELVNPFLELLPLLQAYEAEKDDHHFDALPIEDMKTWEIANKQTEARNEKLPESRRAKPETFDSYCKRREINNPIWERRYVHLMESVDPKTPPSTASCENSLHKWGELSTIQVSRESWLSSTFGPEIHQQFGSPYIVDSKFIPITLVSLLRNTKIVM